MKGNGNTNLDVIRSIINSAMNAVVDFDGRINLDDVIRLLEQELGSPAIEQILQTTGKENLTELVTMFL